jgi:hypothetical protein
MLPSACSFIVDVSRHCLTLHVSAYMAIFMCVGYFIFIFLNESASLVFCLFLHVLTVCILSRVCPGLHSAPNRNEYQKQKNNVSGEQSAAGA